MNKEFIPLVEKYRPTQYDNIVLDPQNKQILRNIIETSYFPNLLFYGPPGTGKTTTIINVIDAYQTKLKNRNKDLIIHLNASDERGIDIIRNQISSFVNSKPLFNNGMKFVILDEVDYMTKNAQQALRYLLQTYSSNVRFCLICNYISKMDEGLQNEFIRLRFNQLPKDEIIGFLKHISDSEKLNMSDKSLTCIQQLYKSDIRSMINFMQTNQDIVMKQQTQQQQCDDMTGTVIAGELYFNIIDNDVWLNLMNKIANIDCDIANNNKDSKDSKDNKQKEHITSLFNRVHEISMTYNIDKKNIIKDFLNYIIRNHPNVVTSDFLKFVENIMHSDNSNTHVYVYNSLSRLSSFL